MPYPLWACFCTELDSAEITWLFEVLSLPRALSETKDWRHQMLTPQKRGGGRDLTTLLVKEDGDFQNGSD